MSLMTTDNSELGAKRVAGESLTEPAKISVVVVADELLFRLGLARLLSEDERLEVIAVSDGESELLELCRETPVDIVVMDMTLSRADSVNLVRSITAASPKTQMLVLTSTMDWRIRSIMMAGAAGILLKDSSPQAISAAVVSVYFGDRVLSSEASQWLLGETPKSRLTQRESDVLHMVTQGATNAQIAAQLGLGEKTVRNYVSRLYRKLSLNSRAEIATSAVHADLGADQERTEWGWRGPR
jgi:DNA-binding NarL/FixJ family response regulator